MLQVAHIINDNLQQFAYCLASPQSVTSKTTESLFEYWNETIEKFKMKDKFETIVVDGGDVHISHVIPLTKVIIMTIKHKNLILYI
jgi:hypothetical protein